MKKIPIDQSIDFRALIDSYDLPVTLVDLDGDIIFINAKGAANLDSSPGELVGKSIYTLFPGKAEILKDRHRKVIASGKAHEFEDVFVLQSGKRFFWSNLHPVKTSTGEIYAIQITSYDTTARKRAENALRDSQEKYLSLFESTGTATFVTEEDMTISRVNAKCEELSGYSREEIVGRMKTTDFIPVEELERIKNFHYGRREKDHDIPPEYELKLIDKQGNAKTVLIQVGVIPGTKQSIASIIDVTQQKRAENALRESEKRYKSLFRNNHSVMLLIDPETADIVDANPAALSYYGWCYEEMTNRKITDINILDKEQIFREMEKAKSRQRQYFHFRHRLANGDIRDVEVYSGPIELHGKQLLYSIIHDITDRVTAERDREKLIDELQTALAEIKTLRGILPICASCKKIRDDKGYWNQLETYIHDHSEAEFSHWICPDCMDTLYGGQDWYKKREDE